MGSQFKVLIRKTREVLDQICSPWLQDELLNHLATEASTPEKGLPINAH